jgi:hypothetical protein
MTREAHRYWIAINGSSCAMSVTPMRNATTIPIAEQMFGFPTLEEAKEARRICLHEPMERVEEFFDSLHPHVASGRIVHKRSANPDPPTSDATMWLEAPTTIDDGEIPKALRASWAKAQDGVLPGLPGGPPFKH